MKIFALFMVGMAILRRREQSQNTHRERYTSLHETQLEETKGIAMTEFKRLHD